MTLDLGSYEGTLRGVTAADGSRRSIVRADSGDLAPLVARLLRRHAEAPRDTVTVYRDPLSPVARDQGSDPVGMPLGLPALSVDDLKIVATWIAQGTPR